MRKFLVLLLVSCAVLTDAQVLTLQHSYEGTGYFYNSINRQTKESLMYEDNVDELYGDAYYSELLSYEDSTFTITTYNEDYSFQSMKQFHIPGGHLIAMISVQLSKCTFDDDSNTYEMLVLYIDQSAPTYNNKYLLRLYREDGTLLYDFGRANSFTFSTALHMYNGEYRLWISKNLQRDELIPDYGWKTIKYTQNDVYKVNKGIAAELTPIQANEVKFLKVVEDGHVYVIRDGRKYDMRGFVNVK